MGFAPPSAKILVDAHAWLGGQLQLHYQALWLLLADQKKRLGLKVAWIIKTLMCTLNNASCSGIE